MKVVTPAFDAMRDNGTIPGTKTRLTISRYDVIKTPTGTTWNFVSDLDITDRLYRGGLPNISGEIEDDWTEFVKDNVNIDLLDTDHVIRDLIQEFDRIYLLKIEKGFDGIADWITKFDGIIYPFKTICKGRNTTSITAYSLEVELEMHPATDSVTSGAVNQTLTTLVDDLFDLSYINIPAGNRTIEVPPFLVPLADYTDWNAEEALDNLAKTHGCIWKRTERDIAWFATRCYIEGTYNLDTDLYKSNYEYWFERGSDGVRAENTTLGLSEDSVGYVTGFNIKEGNQLVQTANDYWIPEEMFSGIRYNRRLFKVPSFYILELEPLDRINLTLRDKDGNLDETVFTRYLGFEYNDINKISELKLMENKPFLYERYNEPYAGACRGFVNMFGNNWAAQTYTLGTVSYDQDFDLTSVRLHIYRNGNPTFLTVEIRNTVGGQPGPIILGTKTIACAGISANLSYHEIEFNPNVAQIATTQYAVVCSVLGGGAGNFIGWRYVGCAATAANYAGGETWRSIDGGMTWNSAAPAVIEDFHFEVWGTIP